MVSTLQLAEWAVCVSRQSIRRAWPLIDLGDSSSGSSVTSSRLQRLCVEQEHHGKQANESFLGGSYSTILMSLQWHTHTEYHLGREWSCYRSNHCESRQLGVVDVKNQVTDISIDPLWLETVANVSEYVMQFMNCDQLRCKLIECDKRDTSVVNDSYAKALGQISLR